MSVIRNRPEEQLQKAVAQYLDLVLPKDAVWWHTPNQRGTRKGWENKMLSAMGVKAGVPDCVILWNKRLYCVELKAPREYLSDAQKDMHDRLRRAGAKITLARCLEDVEDFLLLNGILSRRSVTVEAMEAV